jgi:DNA-binding LacI/PurR family transcriptional regulator
MAIIETFHRRRVDGILVASSRISSNYKERLDSIQVPTVLINSQAESHYQLLHWVAVDDYKGAQLAVEHLLELGHRSIGYLGIDNRPKANRQRYESYQDALAAAGVPYQDDRIAIASGTDASHEEDVAVGHDLAQNLLNSGVTSIFCFNDMLAIGVLLACRERGIAVPQEVSIVGFDDIKLADYVTPSLTTIHQPKVRLGNLATETLLNLLDGHPVQNHLLTPSLKLRNSTAPPSRR